jgi:hypothetical protein
VLALANGLTAVREFHRPSDLLGLRASEALLPVPLPRRRIALAAASWSSGQQRSADGWIDRGFGSLVASVPPRQCNRLTHARLEVSMMARPPCRDTWSAGLQNPGDLDLRSAAADNCCPPPSDSRPAMPKCVTLSYHLEGGSAGGRGRGQTGKPAAIPGFLRGELLRRFAPRMTVRPNKCVPVRSIAL